MIVPALTRECSPERGRRDLRVICGCGKVLAREGQRHDVKVDGEWERCEVQKNG